MSRRITPSWTNDDQVDSRDSLSFEIFTRAKNGVGTTWFETSNTEQSRHKSIAD